MRTVQHALKFVTGMDDVSVCLLVTAEDVWQFRAPPGRDVVVLRILPKNSSFDGVTRVLIHEDERLEVVPQHRRDLLCGHLERSFSGQQDVTMTGGSKNGSEQR